MSKKKKVLYLTNIPSPYRVDFFNELGKMLDLEVIFELPYASDRDSKWQELKAVNYKETFLKSTRVKADASISFEIIKRLSRRNYDEVIIGGYSTPTAFLAIIYLWLKRIRFGLNADGGFVKEENKIKFLIKKFFISKASYWLSTGKKTDEYLIYYGAKKENVHRYPFASFREKDILHKPMGLEEKKIIKEKYGINEKKVILFVGQFIYRKGIDILLSASDGLRQDIGVYIVGGEATEEYLEIINEKKLENVHFLKFSNKETIKELYMASDVFVLPTREDIWGLVINEAMSYGLPVITTDRCIAGLELVGEENGKIISVDDVESLRSAMQTVLAIPSEKFFYSNYQVISNYTIENMAKVHAEIIENISIRGKDNKNESFDD